MNDGSMMNGCGKNGCGKIEPLLSAWLDRALSRAESAQVAAHLPLCGHCQREVHSLQHTAALLRAAPARALPQEVRTEVRTALAATATVHLQGPNAFWRAVRRATRFGTAVFLTMLAALGAAAYAVGGSDPGVPRVAVPVDGYVHDQLLHTSTLPAGPPALVEVGRVEVGR